MALRRDVLGRQLLDLFVYATALTAIVTVVAGGIGVLTGDGLLTVKYLLFVVGFVVFAVGTFKLRPRPPWKDESRIPSMDDQPLQIWLQDHWPLSNYGLRADERLPAGLKIMTAGLLMLAVSFILEAVFGVVR